MAAAAENGWKAGRREVTADRAKVRRARHLKAQGFAPADIGKIMGASRATVYRYLRMGQMEVPWELRPPPVRRPANIPAQSPESYPSSRSAG
ncbi:terminase gpP N-terminus-related DNA-binding protein [Arthrobacter sp. MDT2-2]